MDNYKNKYIQSSLIHNDSVITDFEFRKDIKYDLPLTSPKYLSDKNLDNDINIKQLIDSGILRESNYINEIKNLEVGEIIKIAQEPNKVIKKESKFIEMCNKISKNTIKSLYFQFIDISTYYINYYGLKDYFDLFEITKNSPKKQNSSSETEKALITILTEKSDSNKENELKELVINGNKDKDIDKNDKQDKEDNENKEDNFDFIEVNEVKVNQKENNSISNTNGMKNISNTNHINNYNNTSNKSSI